MPKVEILGDRERYVKTGSKVLLQCAIKNSLEIPFYTLWYHHERQLPDPKDRPDKVSVHTKLAGDGTNDTYSNLTIHDAGPADSGNYTCRPSNLESTSVQLHVLNGE